MPGGSTSTSSSPAMTRSPPAWSRAFGSRSCRNTPTSFRTSKKLYIPGAYLMQEMARGQAFVIDWYPSGPLHRIRARPRQGRAGHGREAAGLVQGQSGPLHVCPAGQFRSRPHLRDGPALSPRRQGPAGPDQGLGQDLGLSQGAGRLHRILHRRHHGLDEGARQRHARHHRHHHRLGHQSALSRHRAGGVQDRRPSRAFIGSATPTTWRSPRASPKTSSRSCSN